MRSTPEQTAPIVSMVFYFFPDPLIFLAYWVPHLEFDRLPTLAYYDYAENLKSDAFPHSDVSVRQQKAPRLLRLCPGIPLDSLGPHVDRRGVVGIHLPHMHRAQQTPQVTPSFLSLGQILISSQLPRKSRGGIHSWFWVLFLFVGPRVVLVEPMAHPHFALITQFVFERALCIRMKAETGEKVAKDDAATSKNNNLVGEQAAEMRRTYNQVRAGELELPHMCPRTDIPAAKRPCRNLTADGGLQRKRLREYRRARLPHPRAYPHFHPPTRIRPRILDSRDSTLPQMRPSSTPPIAHALLKPAVYMRERASAPIPHATRPRAAARIAAPGVCLVSHCLEEPQKNAPVWSPEFEVLHIVLLEMVRRHADERLPYHAHRAGTNRGRYTRSDEFEGEGQGEWVMKIIRCQPKPKSDLPALRIEIYYNYIKGSVFARIWGIDPSEQSAHCLDSSSASSSTGEADLELLTTVQCPVFMLREVPSLRHGDQVKIFPDPVHFLCDQPTPVLSVKRRADEAQVEEELGILSSFLGPKILPWLDQHYGVEIEGRGVFSITKHVEEDTEKIPRTLSIYAPYGVRSLYLPRMRWALANVDREKIGGQRMLPQEPPPLWQLRCLQDHGLKISVYDDINWTHESSEIDSYTGPATSLPSYNGSMPTELKTALLPHQCQALQWALEQEDPQLPSVDHEVQFWRKYKHNTYTNSLLKYGPSVTEKKLKSLLGRGGLLADDMGKTLTILALIIVTKGTRIPGFVDTSLIVAPLSVLTTWNNEINIHSPSLRYTIYRPGTSQLSTPTDFEHYDVVLTNYDSLLKNNPLSSIRWKSIHNIFIKRIILDESHKIRNPKSKSHQAVVNFGTWYTSDLSDQRVLKYISLRRTKEMQDQYGNRLLHLPKVTYRTIEVTLGPEQQLSEHMLTLILRLRQAVLHPRLVPSDYHVAWMDECSESSFCLETNTKCPCVRALFGFLGHTLRTTQYLAIDSIIEDNDEDRTPMSSAKLDVLVTLLKQTAERDKSLVFSCFIKFLKLAERRLSQDGIDCFLFHGQMTSEERTLTIAKFARSVEPRVMLISLAAGAFGLNLTVANNVYLMDPWWQPSIERQAVDRVNRIGQTKEVNVFRLLAQGTIEEKVLQIQAEKAALIQEALSETKRKATTSPGPLVYRTFSKSDADIDPPM
ncbi:P-loop containing nucleoside triphosphate hydrolase protein [Mycena maculata]|uniref:P-loop containing nucleoside triphosphate hydrolase protein n=1 Tax=Mycena maculata TaxID=230809 RepID=A0AAD7JQ77_9AGAR|nr:P-loop containing nucleoside triphosphate hydrolase protein [Mycena maculata]